TASQRPPAPCTAAEGESQRRQRSAWNGGSGPAPDATPVDVRLACEGFRKTRAPVRDGLAQQQPRVVAEVRDHDRGPQLIDRRQRAAGELTPTRSSPTRSAAA